MLCKPLGKSLGKVTFTRFYPKVLPKVMLCKPPINVTFTKLL